MSEPSISFLHGRLARCSLTAPEMTHKLFPRQIYWKYLRCDDSIPQTAASHGECKLMQMHLTRLANITLGPPSAGAADRVGGGA